MEVNHGRREPAGLCGLRKQVTEAEEGPLELRGKKGRANTPGEGWGEDTGVIQRERERASNF